MKAGVVDCVDKPLDDRRRVEALLIEAAEAGQRIATLTPREREVLDALVAGRANKLIATDLGISVRTVEMHRARMLERLGVHGLAEAVRLAVMATLVPRDATANVIRDI